MEPSPRHYNLRSQRQRRQDAYKHTSIPRTTGALHAQHRARDQEIRKEKREQWVLGKRFRHRRLSNEQGNETADSDVDAAETDALSQQLQGFLTSTDAEEQLQALWCITNIAAAPKLQCQQLQETVPYLIGFLRHSNEAIQNQAAWALGNLALEGPSVRRLLRENGVILPLVDLLGRSESEELVKTASFTVSSMLHGEDTRSEQYVEAGLLDHLKRHLTTDQVDRLDQLREHGILALPLIRAIANIIAGPDEYTDAFMDCPSLLASLQGCLDSIRWVEHITMPLICIADTAIECSSRPVRKETLWLLSNLTAGMEKHVRQVIDAGLLDTVCRIFAETDFDLRKEASYIIMNVASRGRDYFDRLPLSCILPGYVDFLHAQDRTLLQMALTFVQITLDDHPQARSLLQQAGVPDALDSATLNQQSELHQMAGHLLDEIFEEDALSPANAASTASPVPLTHAT
ncbi:armadillo-type protein [Syncephalis pseudoplumigaleata]|uniref:Armadillo-type protein n=1 Tax=Syncephalis pseudoplumigaleata TaxID=1712513 RepID=A0A4V1J217_9FUNG|nr:armadillo-type protein [Syncephalis pseudoplumigaleata]|eukprot:RKP26999.1 armadillo-type protein [Syncephalis pseudoplumigaleata]